MRNGITPQQLLSAVMNYVGFDSEDATRICEEAQAGNKVAQYIVGVALLREDRAAAAERWLYLSASQDYEPARRLFSAQAIAPVVGIAEANW